MRGKQKDEVNPFTEVKVVLFCYLDLFHLLVLLRGDSNSHVPLRRWLFFQLNYKAIGNHLHNHLTTFEGYLRPLLFGSIPKSSSKTDATRFVLLDLVISSTANAYISALAYA